MILVHGVMHCKVVSKYLSVPEDLFCGGGCFVSKFRCRTHVLLSYWPQVPCLLAHLLRAFGIIYRNVDCRAFG